MHCRWFWFAISPPSRAHSYRIISLLCTCNLVLELFDKHATDNVRGEWLGIKECMHRIGRKDKSNWKKNEKTATSRRWGKRDEKALGRKVWVETDAGEETHTVAANLGHAQQVVGVNLQTVRRNEYQHMRRDIWSVIQQKKVSMYWSWAHTKNLHQRQWVLGGFFKKNLQQRQWVLGGFFKKRGFLKKKLQQRQLVLGGFF